MQNPLQVEGVHLLARAGGGGEGGRGYTCLYKGEEKGGDTCLLELSHVGIHKWQASLAILPPLKSLGVLIPPHLLPSDAILCKDLVAMLLSEEPACRQGTQLPCVEGEAA